MTETITKTEEHVYPDGAEIAREVVEAVENRKATDIAVLDIRGLSTIADYFVLANGESDRQLRAMVNSVEDSLSEYGLEPHHVEGSPESGWILVDYLDVLVHLFTPAEREYYRLEQLWNDAKVILHIQ